MILFYYIHTLPGRWFITNFSSSAGMQPKREIGSFRNSWKIGQSDKATSTPSVSIKVYGLTKCGKKKQFSFTNKLRWYNDPLNTRILAIIVLAKRAKCVFEMDFQVWLTTFLSHHLMWQRSLIIAYAYVLSASLISFAFINKCIRNAIWQR